MQKRWNAGSDDLAGRVKIAPEEDARFARFARQHGKSGRTFRPLLVEGFDALVGLFPLRHRCPPVAEQFVDLRIGAFRRADQKKIADSAREWVSGTRAGVGGHGDSESAQAVVAAGVAGLAAVLLDQAKGDG